MESKMQDLERILAKMEVIVSPNFCEVLAKSTQLVRRSTSQLKGYEFAQALMIPNAFLEAETLNSLAARMQTINKLCNLTAPALAQRINTKSAERFMKACFGRVLKEIIHEEISIISDLPNLSGFNRVLIEDSTKAELHEKLGEHYRGSGGASSKSSVKIDYIFDYISEQFISIDFCAGNIPDQSLANRIISILSKDDLVIRDLGYYALARLKEIEQGGAYYISRYKSDIVVYENQEASTPLDLAKFLDKKIASQNIVDIEVFIGKEKHPVRLVACLMSEEAVNKRRRDANRSAQRTGTQISKKKSSLLKYGMFITNVPATILSATVIMATYRARWRVELIFKQWKSCLKLHVFKGYNKERFHCLLYGRLIMILLLGSISSCLMFYARMFGRELSTYKLTNYLIADNALLRTFQEGRISQFIDQLLKDLPRRLCMDKRKRLSLRSNVRAGNSWYNQLKENVLEKNVGLA
jgi:hypothetical protein